MSDGISKMKYKVNVREVAVILIIACLPTLSKAYLLPLFWEMFRRPPPVPIFLLTIILSMVLLIVFTRISKIVMAIAILSGLVLSTGICTTASCMSTIEIHIPKTQPFGMFNITVKYDEYTYNISCYNGKSDFLGDAEYVCGEDSLKLVPVQS